MKRRFSEEEIVQILREGEAAESKAEVWHRHGVSAWAYYRVPDKDLESAGELGAW